MKIDMQKMWNDLELPEVTDEEVKQHKLDLLQYMGKIPVSSNVPDDDIIKFSIAFSKKVTEEIRRHYAKDNPKEISLHG